MFVVCGVGKCPHRWIVWQCRFLTMHSSDQSKVCCPLTSFQVRRSPKPFLTILEYCKESKSEAGEGLGTRLCILFASYPACCQYYAVCNFLRLLQSFQFLVTYVLLLIEWTLSHMGNKTNSGGQLD